MGATTDCTSAAEYTGEDPLGFVIEKNLLRRDLTVGQRAMIAVKIANMRQGERTDLNGDGEPSTNLSKVSQPEAAKIMGVGEVTVRHAKKVSDSGTEEEIEAVTSGKEAPSRAAKIIREKEADIKKAAADDPDRFGDLAERLKAGEKVDPLHKTLRKRQSAGTTKKDVMKDALGVEVPSGLRRQRGTSATSTSGDVAGGSESPQDDD